ncbi:TPA: N-glycosylase/DNA lyase [Candidatus Woesearchaeota archaeon]|nr:N-glycosylase/DNA lyase [Candidatus Woesearchaeota archaeon]
MRQVLKKINQLKKSEVRSLIDSRLAEFKKVGKGGDNGLFNELCFCILTANWQAEGGIRIQKAMKEEFCSLPQARLAARLRELGYRFPNVRAGYIAEAQKHQRGLGGKLKKFDDPIFLREWVVKNVKGLGYKEASHFLRNIGYEDLAILDFHIIDIMEREGLIERPKTLTPKRYVEIEAVLKELGRKAGLNMAELDMYLWYMETGKVLK